MTRNRCALIVACLCAVLIGSPKAFSQGLCLNDADADIVIMIDRTGSISESEMMVQKNAAKALLDFFSTATVKPQVAIGTFNVQGGPDARIEPGGNLTEVYGTSAPATGLYAVIDAISSSGSGFTNLGAAIAVAQAELSSNAQSTRRFMALISDGITNRPSGLNPDSCSGGTPGSAANLAADLAEAAGSGIFAIHYGDDSGCPAGTGVNFLQNEIATSPTMYYEGNGDLSGVFEEIAQAIVCDDQDACTIDVCVPGVPPTCDFIPDLTDSDQDGVPDCEDQCPGGDDTQIGESCEVGVGSCQNTGMKVCERNQIVCDAQPGDPQAETCNGLDDDCDELVDEGFNVGMVCMVGVGACMNTGEYECTPDGGSSCNAEPGSPATEVCDGVDNDCDGALDEGVCESVCEESDITSVQSGLDGLGEEQRKVVKKASVLYERSGGKKQVGSSARDTANELYMENWSVIWSIDSVVQTNCTNAEFCVEVSNVASVESYQGNAAELYSTAKKMIRRLKRQLKRSGKGVGRANRLNKRNEALFAETGVLSEQIPTSTLSCQ